VHANRIFAPAIASCSAHACACATHYGAVMRRVGDIFFLFCPLLSLSLPTHGQRHLALAVFVATNAQRIATVCVVCVCVCVCVCVFVFWFHVAHSHRATTMQRPDEFELFRPKERTTSRPSAASALLTCPIMPQEERGGGACPRAQAGKAPADGSARPDATEQVRAATWLRVIEQWFAPPTGAGAHARGDAALAPPRGAMPSRTRWHRASSAAAAAHGRAPRTRKRTARLPPQQPRALGHVLTLQSTSASFSAPCARRLPAPRAACAPHYERSTQPLVCPHEQPPRRAGYAAANSASRSSLPRPPRSRMDGTRCVSSFSSRCACAPATG